MPIKQLQLRGISRTPSDRASADGGCAESLNVHLDQGETAPTMPPEDISGDIYPASMEGTDRYQVMFIHKMTGVTNYIGIKKFTDGSLFHYGFQAYGSTLYEGVDNMGGAVTQNGETPQSFTSIGNTLIVYTDRQPFYFLFGDGSYSFLGNQIPKPAVEIVSVPKDPVSFTTFPEEGLKNPDLDWNEAYEIGKDTRDAIIMTIDRIWGNISETIASQRQDGSFSAPFFLRYALRLYDGNYIYSSSPILCGGWQSSDWVTAKLITTTVLAIDMTMVSATLRNLFQVYMRCEYSAGGWSDIVKAIDFFASEPIYAPAIGSAFGSVDASKNIIFETMDPDTRDQTIKDAVLTKGQFYKVASVAFGSNDMTALNTGAFQLKATDFINGEKLATQEEMVDGYRDGNQYIPERGCMDYNKRVLLMGANELLTRGDALLNGQVYSGVYENNPVRYAFRFKIVDSNTAQSYYVYANYIDGGKEIFPAWFYTVPGYGSNVYHYTYNYGSNCLPYAWISYPDTRCKEVQVFYKSTGGWASKYFPMEEHPYLNCSYAFFGFGVVLKDANYSNAPYSDINAPETRMISAANKLMLSSFENPFQFPLGNIITFSDPIVGAATTSVPLSEGQFGDFPLYVFTEGGIRMLITTAEGTFAANMTPPNLSRHIALPGTIMPIEQAIVFTTEKGVMMLVGSNVTEISREMIGMPFVINGDAAGDGLYDARALLRNSDWSSILGPTIDSDTFMAFMREAKPVYDNNAGRIIFFNEDKQYQYVYMLETRTWHKIYTSMSLVTPINSFPECLVSWRPNSVAKVMNFSTILKDSSLLSREADPVLGIIATRPFDLGEPDIRKAIRSIRIRGNYNRDNVKYLLLGSFDGINWKLLRSLRGGSYKQFMLIILTDLTATERITWVDIDYESRFTNRLR